MDEIDELNFIREFSSNELNVKNFAKKLVIKR